MIKHTHVIKDEVKLSLFADVMLLYIEYPKEAPRKVLESINEASKFAGNNTNMQKPVVILCANKEQCKNEIRKTIPFIIEAKSILKCRNKFIRRSQRHAKN